MRDKVAVRRVIVDRKPCDADRPHVPSSIFNVQT